MIGNPKFNYNDKVTFILNGELCVGVVSIIDAYGTFEQNEEPSYDIMVDDFNGAPALIKHIRESSLTLVF